MSVNCQHKENRTFRWKRLTGPGSVHRLMFPLVQLFRFWSWYRNSFKRVLLRGRRVWDKSWRGACGSWWTDRLTVVYCESLKQDLFLITLILQFFFIQLCVGNMWNYSFIRSISPHNNTWKPQQGVWESVSPSWMTDSAWRSNWPSTSACALVQPLLAHLISIYSELHGWIQLPGSKAWLQHITESR